MSTETIVEAIASAHIALCGSPRAAAAVVDEKGIVLATWGKDATPQTVFRIASMTKSFTAALLLCLRDEGVLSLDAPIADAAPELASVVGPGIDPTPITLRHLVTQSSGLATDDPWADRHLDATDDDLDRWVGEGLRFAYPTGSAFEYSNLGFALIGRVVHRITGRRLQELLTERLLQPLAMDDTRWTVSELPGGADVTQGMHRIDGSLVAEVPLGDGVIAPMGGLWSTAADLCTWMSFLSSAFTSVPLNGPLSARSRREMQQMHRYTKAIRLAAADGSMRIAEGGYCMGLTTFHDEQFGTVVTHSGGLPGYGSNMRWMPGGIGVVIMANVTYAPMWHAGAALLDALGHAGIAKQQSIKTATHLEIAATKLASLFCSWSDAAANALFADNVLLDVPADVRQREIVARLHGASEIEVVQIEAHGEAAATATLSGGGTLQRVRFELAPIGSALIQSYSWN
jgi:CubicO group peptidase (beta-lactamase class C family)